MRRDARHRSATPLSRLARAALAAALLAANAGCGGHAHPRTSAPPGDQVALARKAIAARDWGEAQPLLKGYLERDASGEQAGEAHYLLGLIAFETKEWPSAVTEFSIVINQFGDSPHVPDARYYLGLSYWKQARPSDFDQDHTRRALGEFDRFLALYPDHPRAEEVRRARHESRDRLARKDYENGRLYYKLGYYEPARFYCQEVQKNYPDSSWAPRAALLEARTWAKQQKWSEAQAVLEKLLATPPGGEVEREARRLLEEVHRQAAAPERS